ncbi:glycosyltransferase, partial [Rickettsiaceae bacterium]|nr:glycosyltransferase [Rickettsiaceae bacterium]
KYEIIVADDFSTDETLAIISTYKKQYPTLFKILKTHKNHGITKNYKRAFNECSGTYVAVLEGDDYWISPNKIKLQIDFLEKNLDCSFCSHQLFIHNEVNNSIRVANILSEKKFSTEDLIHHNFIMNFSTCLYRNNVIKQLPDSIYEINTQDWMFNIMNSQYGKIGYINHPLSVYRLHSSGLWSSSSDKKNSEMLLKAIDDYDQILNKKYTNEFQKVRSRLTLGAICFRKFKSLVALLLPQIIVNLIVFLKKFRKNKGSFIICR